GRGPLGAAGNRRFHLGACQLAPDLALERGRIEPAPLEDVLVALEREPPVLLERRDRVDPGVQLLVGHREALGLGALYDQRFLDEVADDLLAQPEALG